MGQKGQQVLIDLSRNHTGTIEYWNGSVWGSYPTTWFVPSVSPSGEMGTYNWSVNIPWPSGANLPRGTYTFHIKAYDNANNRSDIFRSIIIGTPDTKAPAVTIDAPANNYLINNAQETLSEIRGTVNDGDGSGVAYIKVGITRSWYESTQSWNGTSWGSSYYLDATLSAPNSTGTSNWILNSDLPPREQLGTGQYYITVLAYDRNGNRAVVQNRLLVAPNDSIAPTVGVTFPAEGQQLTTLPEIRGTSSDEGSGVSDMRVWLGRILPNSDGSTRTEYWVGSSWATSLTASSFLFNRTDTSWVRNQNLPAGANLSPGRYIIGAQALDRYYNVGTLYRNFNIIPVPPLAIDAHIRADSAGAWLGEGFSNTDAQGQTLNGTIQSDNTQTRYVRLKMSGGSSSKTVRVTIPDWASFADAGWTARFFDAPQGGSEITGQITGASGWITAMSDGGETQIRVEVSAPANVNAGTTRALTFRVEADPTSETSALDVVKAIWNTVVPMPDLSIRASAGNGFWLGEGVRNEDGTDQTLERVAAPGQVVRGEIQLSVADATDGQTVHWSVPGWDALVANGWNVKFFDAPQNGNEITAQISGEGWTTQHTNGYQPVIGFEVTVPADATDVTRVLSVRAQMPGGVADAVKASLRVLPNVRPDVAISRLDKNGDIENWVGKSEFSPQQQQVKAVVSAGEMRSFAVQIKNTSALTAQFLLKLPALPTGWSLKFYNALENGQLLEADDENVILTPEINAGSSIDWKVEVTTGASDTAKILPFDVSAGNLADKVEIEVTCQALVAIEWSLDGKSWGSTRDTAPPKIEWKQTMGLRAVKSNPSAPWPDSQASGPIWRWADVEAIGNTVWVAAEDIQGDNGKPVSALLGDKSKTVTLHARPALNLAIKVANKNLLSGTTSSNLRTTEVSISASSDNRVSLGTILVRLQAISESAQNIGLWNGSAVPYLDIPVGADGASTAIWTSGSEEGQIQFVATALDENHLPRKVSDVAYAQAHKPYALLKTGNWHEENGTWSRTVTASTRFRGEQIGGVLLVFSAQVNDYETQQSAQGWENAAPFAVAAGVTDANGNFSTVQRWNPVEAGAWPHDFEVKAKVELR